MDSVYDPPTALALLAGAVAVQTLTALPSPSWFLVIALGRNHLFCCVRPPLALARLQPARRGVDALARGPRRSRQRLPRRSKARNCSSSALLHGLPRDAGRFRAFRSCRRYGAEQRSRGRAEGVVLCRHGIDDANRPHRSRANVWRLLLRVRRPRGLVDPGAFDFERYALERRHQRDGLRARGCDRSGARQRTFASRGLRARVSQASPIRSARARKRRAARARIRRPAGDGRTRMGRRARDRHSASDSDFGPAHRAVRGASACCSCVACGNWRRA